MRRCEPARWFSSSPTLFRDAEEPSDFRDRETRLGGAFSRDTRRADSDLPKGKSVCRRGGGTNRSGRRVSGAKKSKPRDFYQNDSTPGEVRAVTVRRNSYFVPFRESRRLAGPRTKRRSGVPLGAIARNLAILHFAPCDPGRFLSRARGGVIVDFRNARLRASVEDEMISLGLFLIDRAFRPDARIIGKIQRSRR